MRNIIRIKNKLKIGNLTFKLTIKLNDLKHFK